MNCAELVFLIIRNTNSAQFIGGSNKLITFERNNPASTVGICIGPYLSTVLHACSHKQ